ISDTIDLAGFDVRRHRLDPEYEARARQHGLQGHSDTGLEVPILAALLVKGHQSFEVLRTRGPSISLSGNFRNDFCGTRQLIDRTERAANKYLAAAHRIGNAGHIERPADLKFSQVRILDDFPVIANLGGGQRMVNRSEVVINKLGMVLKECRAHSVSARFYCSRASPHG